MSTSSRIPVVPRTDYTILQINHSPVDALVKIFVASLKILDDLHEDPYADL